MILRLCLLSVALTMIGCQAVEDRGQTVVSAGVQTGQAQQILGPIVGSEKIKSDMRAAGFSVADPKVQWGVTVVVNAEQASGGFFADAETGGIALHWAKVADASNYEIFRSTQPVMPLVMETILTMDAGGNSTDEEFDHWFDNQAAAHTRYYYVVLCMTKTGRRSVVATGSAAMPVLQTQRTNRGSVGPTDPEAADRQAIRKKDSVTGLDMGRHASSAPNGTYGFAWDFDVSGDFLLYTEGEPNSYTHPFEVHKLRDGRYSLVGYLNTDTAKKIREGESNFPLTIYAHRWSGAKEIVSLPIERLLHFLYPTSVTIEGQRYFVINVDWK